MHNLPRSDKPIDHSDDVIFFTNSSAEIFSTWNLNRSFHGSFLSPIGMDENLEDRATPPKTGSRYIVHDVEDPQPAPRWNPPPRALVPDQPIVSQHERQSLIRGLSQRHVQMIAIAGAIVRARTRTLRSSRD